MSEIAALPAHLAAQRAALRLPYTPRRELEPHERQALKPALVPILPADADCRVRTHTLTEVIVSATIGGHRLSLRTTCPAKIFPASEWAAHVAGRFLAWRPPAPVAAPADAG